MSQRLSSLLVICLLLCAGCTGTNPTTTATTPAETSSATIPPSTQNSTATETISGKTWTVTVVRIIDGDTIEVQFKNGTTETVRLLGVDTPEVHTATTPAEFETIPETESGTSWLREWGQTASEYVKSEVATGETIRIAVDTAADRRGSYGRLLVYIYHDGGTLLNKDLLAQGYARVYESSFTKRGMFEDVEATAQQQDRGVWAYTSAESTSSPQATATEQTPVTITTIHADAAGDEYEHLNDEYLVIKNAGETPRNISGWTVTDTADHRYTFPTGTTLAPGETVTLHTGRGDDSSTDLYWGRDSPVWNNNGDTARLQNGSGQTVVTQSYE